VIVQLHHQSVLNRVQICEEDTQIFHTEIPNQFHLQEIGMQDYKSACKTDQWIHRVIFVISEFLDQGLHSQSD